MDNDIPDDLIGLGKAAKMLAVNPATVKRWIDKGRLVGYRVGGRYRVRAKHVREFVRQIPPPAASPAAELTRKQRAAATRAALSRHGL